MKFGIHIKLLIFSLSLTIFSLLIVFLFGLLNSRKIIKRDVENHLTNKSEQIFLSIDRFVEERLADLKTYTSHKNNLNYSGKDLQEFISHHHHFEGISFFTPDRIRKSDSQGYDLGKQHGLSTYWPKLLEHETVADISLSEGRNDDVLHIGVSIQHNNQIIGYLVGRIELHHLYSTFKHALTDSKDQDMRIELISSNGKLLYSNLGFASRHSQLNFYNEAFKNETFENDRVIRTVFGQLSKHSITNPNWYLLLTAEKRNVYAEIENQTKQFTILLGSVLVFVVLISITFSLRLTKPIRKLSQIASEYGKGKFEIDPAIKSENEIGVLANSMKRMAQNIQLKIKEQAILNKQLNTQYLKEKDQKRLITSSIRYASKIQKALLPSQGLHEYKQEAYQVFYQPKDIVSGDFYFIRRIHKPNGVFEIIAVIDCTGHGVPGALMTMIANNLLNQIVGVEKESRPSIILERIDRHLFNMFNHSDNFDSVKDGMDISILSFNLDQRSVAFSGANQRILHFRNRHKIEVHRGLRSGLGEGKIMNSQFAKNQELRFNYGPEDLFILYTDGIVDQFGGESNVKFTKRKLIELIENHGHSGAEEIFEAVIDELQHWKLGQPQTDDMLMVFVDPSVFKSENHYNNKKVELHHV